ncbi:protein kinase domain-containing protein [Streptomyces zagrosensis]|uniref:non-specific serine/threonine protein kinase n=1 Tax=Streptomyces zagrosensis TaxID=1042984 RepID=A0A7W9QAI8_9ACTN|nr:protein kinase [Streptomyces zagrosensis]MBB5936576.1 serine/threonine protein kinase [Streptomyces zagrosensis]
MRLDHHGDERYRLKDGPIPGGRSEVWLARDTQLGQDVALKRARIEDNSSAAFERLQAEARALARFREHPHVVTLYDAVRVGEGADAECWLVMEYASGGSLVGRPAMSPQKAAKIGAQIAWALVALHASGIVHCDVKPGNIVLSDGETAKLTDLDSAHRVGGTETITCNQSVSYTPDYAAPEVVRGNPVRASDVFSLGATVYELIVGRPPRHDGADSWSDDGGSGGGGAPSPRSGAGSAGAGSTTEFLGHGDEQTSPQPSEDAEGDERVRRWRYQHGVVRLDGDVGPLRELLHAMLATEPANRPTASEVRKRFQQVAGDIGVSAPDAAEPPSADANEPSPPGVAEAASSGAGKTAPPNASEPHAPDAADPTAPGDTSVGSRGGDRTGWLRNVAGPVRRHPWVTTVAALAVTALGAIGLPSLLSNDGNTSNDANDGNTGAHSAPPAVSHEPDGPRATEPRAADPCGLADPRALSRFGSAQLDNDYGNFERCDIIVERGNDTVVDVKVELASGLPSDLTSPTRKMGTVDVVTMPAESAECERVLLPGGDAKFGVYITVNEDKDRPAPLCEMADAAVRYAAQQLNKGPVPPRTAEPAADSLVRKDACTLLDARALSIIPGIDADDPDVGYGNWECDWHSSTSDIVAALRFDRGQPLTASDGRRTQLGGRPAFVSPKEEGPDTCLVRVEHRAYSDHDGQRAMEMLHLVVSGSQPTDELCTMATELATSAAAELPQTVA